MEPDSPYQSPATFEPPPFLARHSNNSLTMRQILFSFEGRIPRRTYWLWVIIVMVAMVLAVALVAPLLERQGTAKAVGTILSFPFIIFFVWVNLAIRVKRWHDHDKSWLWLFIGIIPYAGGIISFIFLGCMRGSLGPNRYGDDPT